ncbi:MAG: hypothetical protein K0R25_286 [Rickettsiaceae bacterium]|jgi:chromosome segregation ATPase|nr:hypothetical protein [Rickettsiaceae bacterium]
MKDQTEQKALGGSSYKNSKQKKKLQKKLVEKEKVEQQKVTQKDRQLKSKIRNLEKELARLSRVIEGGKVDQKDLKEKSAIEKKISGLKPMITKYRPKPKNTEV